jgi:UDP-glucose:(heptosyl)LPS alpha-1,3-glucosyltransferase
MRIAFALYKYFPYGGLARDFVRIANICSQKGYQIDVYVMEWHGEKMAEYHLRILECKGLTNHAKASSFHQQLADQLKRKSYDVVVGFNKMPSLDVYYAADPCYVDRFVDKGLLHKLNPRYRFYSQVEKAVFGGSSKTVCLMISDVQTELFKRHYGTPKNRLVSLPPGIDKSRRRVKDAEKRRSAFRKVLNIAEKELLVLMVGSAFKTKGVDRSIKALASLPVKLREKTHLIVVGEGDVASYERLAKENDVAHHVHLMGGRSDVPDFLLAADLLLHPARKENTGTVILEAMVAGLPMLVTDNCGYAKYVDQSKAGIVISSPFKQQVLNEQLASLLLSDSREALAQRALTFADREDLYSMPEKAVEAIEQVAKEKAHAF